jgi:HEAT repeat protein
LIQALQDDNALLRQQALWALSETHSTTPEVREALYRALKDSDPGVRGGAALAVSQFGPSALPALTEALRDEAPAVRAQAVIALPFLKADSNVVRALLLQAQHDDKPSVRAAAVGALTTFGPKGVPALLEALQDPDDAVWRKAVDGLTKVNVPDKTLLPLLTDALKDGNAAVRQGAAFAMERFGPDAVPLLTQALKDPDRQVCYAATLSLGNIGPVARLAVPAVAEVATTRPEPKLRAAAVTALLLLQDLDRFRDDPPRAVSSLVYRFQGDDAIGRFHAILTTGVLGPAAREAIPALEEATRSTDPQTAKAARDALRRIRPGP